MRTRRTLSVRDHLIISQALYYGIQHLKALEDRPDPYPHPGEHAEPSNRADMEALYSDTFPMFIPHHKIREAHDAFLREDNEILHGDTPRG